MSAGGGRTPLAAKIALLLGFLLLLNYGAGSLANFLAFQLWPRHVEMASFILFFSAALYMILLAIPFLPGIEIGLMVMAMFGIEGIVLVYCCTVLALSASFLSGRLLPPRYMVHALNWFHLHRARDLVKDLAPLGPEERLEFLLRSAPSGIVPFLVRHRYLILAVLFNLPGNSILGDGGGIGLVAGMSRLFRFPRYVLLVCLAITPLPLLFLLRAFRP